VDGLPGLVRHRASEVIPIGAPVQVRGWALDRGRRTVAHLVEIELADDQFPIVLTLDRPDIAAAFSAPNARYCGFKVTVPTVCLQPGPSALRLYLRDETRNTLHAVASRNVFLASPFRVAERIEARDSRNRVSGTIDTFEDLERRRCSAGESALLVRANAAVELRGWVVHPSSDIHEVRARVGNVGVVSGAFGLKREDVAQMLGDPADVRCGFSIPIRLECIALGDHPISIEYRTAEDWYRLPGDRMLTIVGSVDDFPGAAYELQEPLALTIHEASRSVEVSKSLRISGAVSDDRISALFLEYWNIDRTVGGDFERHRVALDYPIPQLDEGVGFSLELPAKRLKRGRYHAQILATTADRRAYRRSEREFPFDVIASRGARSRDA
jgi:hypothetical protein